MLAVVACFFAASGIQAERIQLFVTWLFLGLVPLFIRPLWEPDEARYAEIPRGRSWPRGTGSRPA